MTTLDNEKLAKSSTEYKCNLCDYSTFRKNNFNKHLNSIKHKNNENTHNNNAKVAKVAKKYICVNCEKIFNDRAGLWRHNKICVSNNNIHTTITDNDINDDINDKNLIMMLIKENKEIKDMMFEIMKNGITNNTTNNNINSHNKTFNLQVFLNETCKDAMNINDFVDSIKLQLSDFERMGEVGYAQGISDIITSNLQALDITQRPVHCTDKKRETMYVKDQDQWMKEDENKSKIKKMNKRIENKIFRSYHNFKRNTRIMQIPNHMNI